tara:strand:- start:205 stop:1083 length:879 start_codon:yes stop_codon:yes gene_type:complete
MLENKVCFNKRVGLILFFVVATELIGFGLIIPILPQIALMVDSNPFWLGILLSAYSFSQFFATPILGSLSDKYGRKTLLLWSKFGTVISYIILAFSNSIPLFLCARLLDGFTGGNFSVARAYVADVTTEEQRPKGMAIIGMAFGTGFILGPAIGGFLYSAGQSHFIPSLVAGSFSLMALIITFIYLEEPDHKSNANSSLSFLREIGSVFKIQPIRWLCLVHLGYMIIFSAFETTFSVFTFQLFGLNLSENSWLFFYVGILGLLFQGFLARRSFANLRAVVVIGFVFFSLGLH